MMRAFWQGLAGLALMVAPISEAYAQARSEDAATGSVEPVVEVPAAEIAPSAVTSAESEPVLDVQSSKILLQDDLAPGAMIVTDGEPLAIEEALALAIRNNLDVEVQRYAPLVAEANAAGAWGAYDPTLGADMRYDVTKSPNTLVLNNASTNKDVVTGGGVELSQQMPVIGASFSARFDSISTTTRNTIQALDPRYDSAFFLNGRVPLLRDLLWNESWTNVKITGSLNEAAQQEFRQALMDTVQATVNSYWSLVAARDRVRVAQKSLETARALLDQTKTQYEVGVVSQVEVVEAEAGVAQREFELIQTANTFRNRQDELIDIVLGTKLSALTDLQFVPTGDLESYALQPVDVERSVARAFENRPELRIADTTIDQGELDLRFAKSQRLPQLDLEGRYGYVGISGNGNPNLQFGPNPITPPVDTNWGESTDDWFTRDGANNYRVQGIFSIPIPNTAARRRVDRSQFELRRSKASRVRLEQTIILEVRSASRTLFASVEGIEAAERRRLAAEEQLRAERIRLEHGESTPFDVLLREEDLVEAQSQKINALQVFHAAETALDRAEGTILDSHAIEVDAARAPVR